MSRPHLRWSDFDNSGDILPDGYKRLKDGNIVTSNTSLCDSCLYAGSCADSDKGLSFAHHTICWKYVEQGDVTRPIGGRVVPDTLQGWKYQEAENE